MTSMFAVIKKDWRSFFLSPFAYVVFGLYAFLMGFYYTVIIFAYMRQAGRGGFGEQASLDMVTNSLLHANSYILAFMMPLITMRMFAEEKRQNTFELLFTAPIRIGELVTAKFMSVFGMVVVLQLLSLVYFGFLFAWGNPELNVVLSGTLGLFLLMMTYVALGGFISAFFSSQALAAVLMYVLMLFLWILPSVGSFVYFKIGSVEVGPLLSYITPQGHFKPFVDGILYAKHVWFYISASLLLLFLTSKVVESNRWR